MSYVVACLLVGFWVVGSCNGYSVGGLINILLLYAGLIVVARLIARRRVVPASEQSEPVIGATWIQAIRKHQQSYA